MPPMLPGPRSPTSPIAAGIKFKHNLGRCGDDHIVEATGPAVLHLSTTTTTVHMDIYFVNGRWRPGRSAKTAARALNGQPQNASLYHNNHDVNPSPRDDKAGVGGYDKSSGMSASSLTTTTMVMPNLFVCQLWRKAIPLPINKWQSAPSPRDG